MSTLRYILGDHLMRNVAALRDIDVHRDVVIMTEVGSESSVVGFHKQKLVFIYAAMRHFAQSLRDEGITVDYVRLDDEDNTQTLEGELARALTRHRADGVVVTEPGAWRVRDMMDGWERRLGVTRHGDVRRWGPIGVQAYAASGAYINRMSDYCGDCRFSPKTKEGDKACPFTLLYWNFLIENRQKLEGNRRMAMPYRNLDRMDSAQRKDIQTRAHRFLDGLSATADVEGEEPQLRLEF